MRLPQKLTLPDNYACGPAVLANILYMFERTNTPNIAAADKMLQRQPRQPAHLRIDLPCLLHGLTVRTTAPYDPARFAKEGVAYWRKMSQVKWSSYWTPERMAQYQKQEEEVQRQLARFKGRYKFTLDRPTAKDLYKAVFTPKTVVKISLSRGKHTQHAILLHALCDDGQCWAFDAARRPQARPLLARDLKKWYTNAGMIVVSA